MTAEVKGSFCFAIAIMLLWSTTAVAGDIFRCVIKETRHISDAGDQVKYPRDIYAGSVLIADTMTGLVRFSGSQYQFKISQKGSTSNSWILSRYYEGTASNSIMQLSIKVFQKGVPFIFTDLQNVHSGLCAVVN